MPSFRKTWCASPDPVFTVNKRSWSLWFEILICNALKFEYDFLWNSNLYWFQIRIWPNSNLTFFEIRIWTFFKFEFDLIRIWLSLKFEFELLSNSNLTASRALYLSWMEECNNKPLWALGTSKTHGDVKPKVERTPYGLVWRAVMA